MRCSTVLTAALADFRCWWPSAVDSVGRMPSIRGPSSLVTSQRCSVVCRRSVHGSPCDEGSVGKVRMRQAGTLSKQLPAGIAGDCYSWWSQYPLHCDAQHAGVWLQEITKRPIQITAIAAAVRFDRTYIGRWNRITTGISAKYVRSLT